jgi:hypothetical protein
MKLEIQNNMNELHARTKIGKYQKRRMNSNELFSKQSIISNSTAHILNVTSRGAQLLKFPMWSHTKNEPNFVSSSMFPIASASSQALSSQGHDVVVVSIQLAQCTAIIPGFSAYRVLVILRGNFQQPLKHFVLRVCAV